jgi:hypothetical protein
LLAACLLGLLFDTEGAGSTFLWKVCEPLTVYTSSHPSIIFLMRWAWVHLVLRPLFGLLYQPQMIDDGECEAVGGVRIGRGNRSTRRKPASLSLCPPQIPHDLTWARNRRLTAWAMPRPSHLSIYHTS